MDFQKEAWKLVEELRTVVDKERVYKNPGTIERLQKCIADIETILADDYTVKQQKIRHTDRTISRFDQMLKEERNLARAQMADDLKSVLARDPGISFLSATNPIHKYIDSIIDKVMDENWETNK